MDLNNHTRFPALLSRFVASNDVMGASLVVRITYDLVQNGHPGGEAGRGQSSGRGGDEPASARLVPSVEQTWPVSPKPWACEYGPMEPDNAFYKDGTDLFVFGAAWAPEGRRVATMNVVFEVGAFRRDISVFGDRSWIKRGDDLVIGAPQPFLTMPLALEGAFGGSAKWDGLDVAFPDNPNGKGFFLELSQAIGKPLPNIEDPQRLIRRWDDRPAPVGVGVCLPAFSSRLSRGMEYTPAGALKKIRPRLFNSAYPEMIVEGAKAGDRVRLTGVRPDRPLTFDLPDAPVALRMRFDEVSHDRVPTYDQIGVEVEKQRVFITYRHAFRYVLYRRQQRRAELLMREGKS